MWERLQYKVQYGSRMPWRCVLLGHRWRRVDRGRGVLRWRCAQRGCSWHKQGGR